MSNPEHGMRSLHTGGPTINRAFGDITLPPNSVDIVFDLASSWFTGGKRGDKHLMAVLQRCCHPTCVLYTTFAGIFNHWMRAVSSNGVCAPDGEFVDTGTRTASGDRIYQFPLGYVFHDSYQRRSEPSDISDIFDDMILCAPNESCQLTCSPAISCKAPPSVQGDTCNHGSGDTAAGMS